MNTPDQYPGTMPTPEATLDERYASAHDHVKQFADAYLDKFREQGIPEEQLMDGGAELRFRRYDAGEVTSISISRDGESYVISRTSPKRDHAGHQGISTVIAKLRERRSISETSGQANGQGPATHQIGEATVKLAFEILADLSDATKFQFEGLLVKPRLPSPQA